MAVPYKKWQIGLAVIAWLAICGVCPRDRSKRGAGTPTEAMEASESPRLDLGAPSPPDLPREIEEPELPKKKKKRKRAKKRADRDEDISEFIDKPAKKHRTCCKHCGSRSQPCGDSCISLSKTCRKGVGCAC